MPARVGEVRSIYESHSYQKYLLTINQQVFRDIDPLNAKQFFLRSVIVRELGRLLRFHFDFHQFVFCSHFFDVVSDFHRTIFRTAHATEMSTFERVLRQRLIVE